MDPTALDPGPACAAPSSQEDAALDGLRAAGLQVGAWLGSGASSAVYAVSCAGDPPSATAPASDDCGASRSASGDRGATRLALKLLHAEHAGELELVLRFLHEEHAAARVSHPGVVRILRSGLVHARPYLILERLSGSLSQRAPELSPAQRLAVLAQVADAASALHGAGVVHRDLKPANIMFAPGEALCAKIVDLGLAKLSGPGQDLPVSTAATDVLGTAEYRAPELWVSAKDADGAADVYALGVMLYELCAGRLPFAGQRESELMDQHLFAPPPPGPGLPAGLGALLQRMLAKQRARRPSMAQVARALTAAGQLAAASSMRRA